MNFKGTCKIYPLKRKTKRSACFSPMTKAPTPSEKSNKQRDNTKTPPKTSISQGGRVVKLLACGAKGPGFDPGLAAWI